MDSMALNGSHKREINRLIRKRYDEAMSPMHFAAFELSPTHQMYKNVHSCQLSTEEIKQAQDYFRQNFDSEFISQYWRFKARLSPFQVKHIEQARYMSDFE